MIRWVDAFLDRPTGSLASAVAFWSTVTGATPEAQGPSFVRLRTRAGDDWLEIQELQDGPAGCHPDLWVDDLGAAVGRACSVGAGVVAEHDDWCSLRSPAGLQFCVAQWRGAQRVRPRPYAGPDGVVLRPHQLCFDLAPSVFDAEVDFWATVTRWRLEPSDLPEFRRLQPEPPVPVRFLLQRLGEERPASVHLDVSCADIPVARAWHESVGATFVGEWPEWTTMRDPAGGIYCLTDGDPTVE